MCSEDRSSNRKNRRTGIARPSSWRSSSHLPTPCRSRSANPVRECQFGVAHSQRKSMMRRPRPSQTRSRGWPKKTRPSGLPRMTSRSTAKPPVSELESPKLKTTARLPHVDSPGSAAGEQRETHRSQQAAAATEKPTPMAWIITKTRRDGGFVAVGMRERERERETNKGHHGGVDAGLLPQDGDHLSRRRQRTRGSSRTSCWGPSEYCGAHRGSLCTLFRTRQLWVKRRDAWLRRRTSEKLSGSRCMCVGTATTGASPVGVQPWGQVTLSTVTHARHQGNAASGVRAL
ncbi:hypothetical protein BHM03_00007249 [Ensete ventricosum]|nr:hypothetical protein BHM03_00007249 [Ensete ventricosum]